MKDQSGDTNTDITITADFASSVGPFQFSIGRQLSSTPGSPWCGRPECVSRFGPETIARLQQLQLARVRVWVEFKQAYKVAEDKQSHESYHYYLDSWSALGTRVLLNWRTNYLDLVETGIFTEAQLLERSVPMLRHYKERYPNIEWIEVENEPGDMQTYYRCYKFANKLVNEVNAGVSDPQQRLKIGGPTVNEFHVRNLGAFLDCYVSDTSPDKRLDFITYHQYLFGTGADPYANKDFPAKVAVERAQLDALLSARGLDISKPAFVTETGIFPIDRQSNLGFEQDLHIHAAGMAAMDYFYAAQSKVVPFHWTVTHAAGRKAMFVDAIEGVTRPFYHMARLQTMLSGNRYASTTVLTERGLGVGSFAAGTQEHITLMTWNYQWTHQAAYDVQLVLNNLPSAFKQMSVRVERYRLPNTRHQGEMMKVEDRVGPPLSSGCYSIRLPHEPNEIRLIRLTVQA